MADLSIILPIAATYSFGLMPSAPSIRIRRSFLGKILDVAEEWDFLGREGILVFWFVVGSPIAVTESKRSHLPFIMMNWYDFTVTSQELICFLLIIHYNCSRHARDDWHHVRHNLTRWLSNHLRMKHNII